MHQLKSRLNQPIFKIIICYGGRRLNQYNDIICYGGRRLYQYNDIICYGGRRLYQYNEDDFLL